MTSFAQHPCADLVDELHVLRYGNESQRGDQRSVGRRETYQCLESNEASVRHLVERLVMQHEAIVRHRIADQSLKTDPRLQLCIHFGLKEPNAIAALGFAFIECKIGGFEQSFRVVAVLWRNGHANAYSTQNFVLLELHRSCQGGRKTLREGFSLIHSRDPVLHNDEFVSSEPRHHIVNTDRREQTLRKGLEQKIAAIMA